MLGSLAGQALFPTQLPGASGPRLTDTRTTTAVVGAPVQEVFGTDAVAGVVMYTGEVEEVSTTEEVGGKGGPEQDVTSYTYFQTIAVGLCRGPMGGIYQIFENGKLQYDRSPQRDDESETDFANRITATDAYEDTFELYLGDEEQLPDPTLEEELGLGNVPAFRGLMYVVFPHRELKHEQGLRHPNFKFVVYDEGALTCEDITDYATEVMFPWTTAPDPDPRSCLNDHRYTYDLTTFHSTLSGALAQAQTDTGRTLDTNIQNIGYTARITGPISPHIVPFGAFANSGYKHLLFNDLSVSTWLGIPAPNGGIGNGYKATCLTVSVNNIGQGDIFWWSGKNQDYPNPTSAGTDYAESGLWMAVESLGPGAYNPPNPSDWVMDANGCAIGDADAVLHQDDVRIRVERLPRAPDHPCFPRCSTAPPDYSVGSNYCVYAGRILSKAGAWELEATNYKVLQAAWSGTSSTSARLPVGPALPSYHADYNNATFWQDAYAEAVAAGLMSAGKTYGAVAGPAGTDNYPQVLTEGYRLDYSACTLSTEGVSIASIITRICSRVGLIDIDVSDLEDRFVKGYVISRVMDARSAIDPLRTVGYFDIVESGTTLKFPVRGKTAVRTLDADDLGAHEYGGEPPPAVATRKMQDTDLPRQIRIHYRDPDRDYEESEQLSPTRLTTDAVNDVDIECPIAITGTQAVQAAEVAWAEAWAGRWIQQFQLDISHLDLEPADCVIVPVDSRLERVRIIAMDGPANLRKIEGVRDDADGYVSVAIADPPIRPPATIVINSPTTLLLLDLPALRDADDDAGIYAAARPTNANQSWPGVRIYHSRDGGTVFANEAAITNVATIGSLADDLPPGDWHTWDDTGEILVNLDSGAFESRTDADVLGGANALAVGTHGSWKIVQFATAQQLSATQWRLTRLLHGRRGTEHIGDLFAGQTVVLVSGLGIIRLPLENSELGEEHVYKAVTIGTAYATGVDQSFTPEGQALVPFSPVSITGERDTAGDLTISWIRRDRIGQELQSLTPLPMSEASLSFSIDIYDESSSQEVVRTLTSSSESVVYTLADQEEDFGSSPPPSVTVAVHQISAVVGRGTPGVAEV